MMFQMISRVERDGIVRRIDARKGRLVIIVRILWIDKNMFLKVSLHQGKGTNEPGDKEDKKGGQGSVAKADAHGSPIEDTPRDTLYNEVVFFQLYQTIGKFKAAHGNESEHVFEMMPFGTSVILHGGTHILWPHVIHIVMHPNVMGVIKSGWYTKEGAKETRPNVIQKSKACIKDGAMGNEMQGQ